jgi:hypothetical protein
MRRMTFLGSAPWAGKSQARETNTIKIPKTSLFFVLMGFPSFLRSIARQERDRI